MNHSIKTLILEIEQKICQFRTAGYNANNVRRQTPEFRGLAQALVNLPLADFAKAVGLKYTVPIFEAHGRLSRFFGHYHDSSTEVVESARLDELIGLIEIFISAIKVVPLGKVTLAIKVLIYLRRFRRWLFRKPKRVSIIIPTRDRHFLLHQLMESILEMTHTLEDIDITFMVDSDDIITKAQTLYYEARYGRKLDIYTKIVPRSSNPTTDYINRPALVSRGRFVWILNNDTEIAAQDWDLGLCPFEMATGPLYISVDDDVNLPGNCCFPILNRLAIEKLGCFFPWEIPSIWADKALYNIFTKALPGNMPFSHRIRIEHYSHHNKKMQSDAINQRFGELGTKLVLTEAEENAYVERLKK